ncbi:uncharacterized protein CEXT_58781 [Caerostris extrusa]|uniref:Uncharacterized protein n=1 Tax=Caerostris extrusa TaxID=172846 RepID=A0AAV4V1T2_CAEEX|nr:uncharacterized protein CEXT_58781 [Caerostris extrusa]
MKYSSVIVEELIPTRSSRLHPRCIVLTFIAGIVFYCAYSVIQVPVSEITPGRLESGSVRLFFIDTACAERKFDMGVFERVFDNGLELRKVSYVRTPLR